MRSSPHPILRLSGPPNVLGGRLNLVARIARGLTSEVWWAWDKDAGTERAIKLLPPTADKARRFRFLDEAGHLRAVSHPGVVRCHEVGEQDGWSFVVLDNVIGGSLATRVRKDGDLRTEEVVRIAVELLDALHGVHGAGLVHGAVALDHVMLDGDQHVRLVDFGAAVRGVSPDVDVEAAGVMILMLLTGRPPRIPEDLGHSGVPEKLRAPLAAMLGESGARPSAAAAARSIAEAMPSARTPTPSLARLDGPRSRRAIALAAAVVVAGLVAWMTA